MGEPEKFKSSLRSHSGFIDTIKSRDFQKAKKLFLNHIDYTVLNLSPEDLVGTDWEQKID
jgi:DNA-binding GntR family transcriptional regulator